MEEVKEESFLLPVPDRPADGVVNVAECKGERDCEEAHEVDVRQDCEVSQRPPLHCFPPKPARAQG